MDRREGLNERNTTHVVARAIAAERERCAKICEKLAMGNTFCDATLMGLKCAREIRQF